MARSDKMYADSPRLKRNEETGNMEESRPSEEVSGPSEANGENMGTEGNPMEGTPGEMPVQAHQANERHEMAHKHVHEHLNVHRRHEMEHMTHKGDKKELHKKHETEMKEMHVRHEDETKSTHKRHDTDTAPRKTSKETKE